MVFGWHPSDFYWTNARHMTHLIGGVMTPPYALGNKILFWLTIAVWGMTLPHGFES